MKEVLTVETLEDTSIFDKYREVRVKDCIKEIYKEIITDFNAELKIQKKLLKGKGK